MFKQLFRRYVWFIRLYRRPYLIAVIFMLINYGLALAPPWVVGRVADGLAGGWLTGQAFRRMMVFLFLAVGALYGVNYLWNSRLLKGGDTIALVTRRRLMERFRRQGPVFYTQHSVGSLIGKSTNDVSALTDTAGYAVMALFDAVVQPLVLIVMMCVQVSAPLTLLAVLPLPLIMVVALRAGRRLYPLYDQAQESFDDMNEMVLDHVSGVRVVRAYGCEGIQSRLFEERIDDLYRKNMAVVRFQELIPIAARALPALSYVIAIAAGLYGIRSGVLTAGQMVSFMIYLDMMIWPMFAMGDFINVAQMGLASMERIDELLDTPFDLDDSDDRTFEGPADISFRQVSFRYPGSSDEALADVSFELAEGETLGVVGRVGAGKSTLLKQLLRFYPDTGQDIRLGGVPLRTLRASAVRERIGYCPQQPFLFSASVCENILMGLPDAGDPAAPAGRQEAERLERVLDLADLRKDLAQLPGGLETPAGEKGIALSGGQKQRICLARALIRDPDILILDDCLSAVDTETEQTILTRLSADRAGKTTLIAAHRLSCVMRADRILVLADGRICQTGTHDELMANDRWYRAQFERQQMQDDVR